MISAVQSDFLLFEVRLFSIILVLINLKIIIAWNRSGHAARDGEEFWINREVLTTTLCACTAL